MPLPKFLLALGMSVVYWLCMSLLAVGFVLVGISVMTGEIDLVRASAVVVIGIGFVAERHRLGAIRDELWRQYWSATGLSEFYE